MTPQEAEDEKVRADMQRFGRLIQHQLPYGWGFIFLAFPYGQGGRMNYISTADRPDVVRVMYEFIDKTKENWSEHEPELGGAAEDEQLGRARQRVAELEHEHEAMLLKHEHEKSVALESLKAALAEIERLNKIIHYWGRTDKELSARAAQALSEIRPDPCNGKDVATISEWWKETDKLIAQLRKAAQ